MSTLSLLAPVPPSQAAADDYDSDADHDYTPPAPKSAHPSSSRPLSGFQSSSSSSSVSGDSADDDTVQSDSARPSKRQRMIGTRSGPGLEEGESSTRPQPTLHETASPKKRLTFAQLQALDQTHTRELFSGTSGKGKQREVESDGQELVHIRVKRRFAGEDVWEEKMVQASGKEAQIWGSSTDDSQPPPPPLTRMEPNPAGLGHPPTSSAPSSQTDLSEIDDSLSPLPSQSITVNPSPSPPCPSPTTTTASTPTKPVPPRRSPPKKRRGGGLAAAALKMKNKGKKMSTLEKSSMDWRAHRSDELTEEERHQLARNRQEGGGGFLEKQEFLTRVADYRGR